MSPMVRRNFYHHRVFIGQSVETFKDNLSWETQAGVVKFDHVAWKKSELVRNLLQNLNMVVGFIGVTKLKLGYLNEAREVNKVWKIQIMTFLSINM